jgi:hypothetical protein
MFILSSTKLEIRAKLYLLGSEGVGETEEAGGIMTQSLYAHMNKENLKVK